MGKGKRRVVAYYRVSTQKPGCSGLGNRGAARSRGALPQRRPWSAGSGGGVLRPVGQGIARAANPTSTCALRSYPDGPADHGDNRPAPSAVGWVERSLKMPARAAETLSRGSPKEKGAAGTRHLVARYLEPCGSHPPIPLPQGTHGCETLWAAHAGAALSLPTDSPAGLGAR
jgi:hypothetical protein